MSDQRCPECGGEVSAMLTCHTYPQSCPDGTLAWYSCMPCDSATDYFCDNDDCGWDYTAGLNPRNPRAAANESKRPAWLGVSR